MERLYTSNVSISNGNIKSLQSFITFILEVALFFLSPFFFFFLLWSWRRESYENSALVFCHIFEPYLLRLRLLCCNHRPIHPTTSRNELLVSVFNLKCENQVFLEVLVGLFHSTDEPYEFDSLDFLRGFRSSSNDVFRILI